MIKNKRNEQKIFFFTNPSLKFSFIVSGASVSGTNRAVSLYEKCAISVTSAPAQSDNIYKRGSLSLEIRTISDPCPFKQNEE